MKKRIYSGKKYLAENASRSTKDEVWYYTYKYEGQKSFWARTEVSPEDYQKSLIENEIELEASRLKIKFKGKDYDWLSLRKLYDDICEEEIKSNDEDEVNKSLKNKASSWKSRQRKLRKEGKLEMSKVSALNSHGMTWNPKEDKWEQNFLNFKKNGLNTDNEEWVKEQRKLFNQSELKKENFLRLNSVNFPFKELNGEIFKMTKKTTWSLIEKLEKKQISFKNRKMKKLSRD